MSEAELQTLLAFFKALSNESRLKIIGVLAEREATVGELAALLELREPTVSHHLHQLKELGLVAARAEGNSRIYRLEAAELERMSKRVLSPASLSAAAATVDEGAWERKVLRSFMEGERFVSIPASRKKREVLLRWLAERFPRGERLGELEVNALIKRHHPDCATLRRELVGMGLLQRERSVYWRE
jgi:DNA-binding MarR family transcriptional regulator